MRHSIYIVFWFFGFSVSAQTFLEFQAGGASYGFGDLKVWQEDIASSSDFDLSIVESFPIYGAFQGNLLFESGDYHLGGGFSYFSSGGRLGYWDDTGSIIEDQLIQKYGLHLIASYRLIDSDKLILEGRSTVVVNLTSLTLNSSLTIGAESTSQEAKFNSFNPTVLPSLNLKYELLKGFGLQASLGGEIEFFKQRFLLNGNSDVALGLSDGSTAVKHAWTGLQAMAGFYFSFSKSNANSNN